MTARRRRGVLLLLVALASGGLAASEVHDRERRATERLGPSIDVLVAARDLRAGGRIGRAALAIRRVPARFAPPDALTSADGAIGARSRVALASGTYITGGLFAGSSERRGQGLKSGERAVTIQVAGGGAVGELEPGARVDVLVSTETGAAGGRTTLALAGAELLRFAATGESYGDSGGGADPPRGPAALATLRVSVGQATYLTAADNFAREIRLLPRPPRDHTRAGGVVTERDL